MEFQDILLSRLINHGILNATTAKPEDVVRYLGAMQAQDYQNALWAIGLRCKEGTTMYDVQSAISDRKIVRTWLMRGTLHFASSTDVRWMLRLFTPCLRNTALQRDRSLGLSDEVVEKTKSLFSKALRGGRQLSRAEMYSVMEKCGIPSANNLGYHMLYRAAWDGLICFGANDGKQPTFALLDEWLETPPTQPLSDGILAELATRYFTSHGPATIRDYVWWSGLKVSDAKLGIESASGLSEQQIGNSTYYLPKSLPKPKRNKQLFLLPGFDEYILGYTDRSAALGNTHAKKPISSSNPAIIHSNGVFLPTIIVNGKVVGTWARKAAKGRVLVTAKLFIGLDHEQKQQLNEETIRYGQFLGADAVLRCGN